MINEAERLAKNLNIKAGMIIMGEAIAWGSDAGIMDEAAAMIRKLVAEVEARKADAARKDALLSNLTTGYTPPEPVYGMTPDGEAHYHVAQLKFAYAAARVQAINECANVCDRQAIPNAGFLAEKIRALIGKEST